MLRAGGPSNIVRPTPQYGGGPAGIIASTSQHAGGPAGIIASTSQHAGGPARIIASTSQQAGGPAGIIASTPQHAGGPAGIIASTSQHAGGPAGIIASSLHDTGGSQAIVPSALQHPGGRKPGARQWYDYLVATCCFQANPDEEGNAALFPDVDHPAIIAMTQWGGSIMRLPSGAHAERHRSDRIGWLRAAVLGANDGIVSTASLIVGVAAAEATRANVLIAGVAGLVAGAMSMAAGEYVSVSSQADTEQADLARERGELAADPGAELAELQGIYVKRGLAPDLALRVAEQLTAHDALAAHARDELGISSVHAARPIQAAVASAGSFAVGAAFPLLVAAAVSTPSIIPVVSGASIVFLAALGAVAARAGGARALRGALRVSFWGAIAMAVTALIGRAFHTTV